jgi:hypothetical protein
LKETVPWGFRPLFFVKQSQLGPCYMIDFLEFFSLRIRRHINEYMRRSGGLWSCPIPNIAGPWSCAMWQVVGSKLHSAWSIIQTLDLVQYMTKSTTFKKISNRWFSLHKTYQIKCSKQGLYSNEFWSRTMRHSVGSNFAIEYLGEFEYI